MFRGEFHHLVDNKGRMSIPAKYRAILGKDFIIAKGLEKNCLFIYALKDWEELESKIAALPLLDSKARKITRKLLPSAHDVSVDGHGRILVPSVLRKYLVKGTSRDEEAIEEDETKAVETTAEDETKAAETTAGDEGLEVVLLGEGKRIEVWLKEIWLKNEDEDEDDDLDEAGAALYEKGFQI